MGGVPNWTELQLNSKIREEKGVKIEGIIFASFTSNQSGARKMLSRVQTDTTLRSFWHGLVIFGLSANTSRPHFSLLANCWPLFHKYECTKTYAEWCENTLIHIRTVHIYNKNLQPKKNVQLRIKWKNWHARTHLSYYELCHPFIGVLTLVCVLNKLQWLR